MGVIAAQRCKPSDIKHFSSLQSQVSIMTKYEMK